MHSEIFFNSQKYSLLRCRVPNRRFLEILADQGCQKQSKALSENTLPKRATKKNEIIRREKHKIVTINDILSNIHF